MQRLQHAAPRGIHDVHTSGWVCEAQCPILYRPASLLAQFEKIAARDSRPAALRGGQEPRSNKIECRRAKACRGGGCSPAPRRRCHLTVE